MERIEFERNIALIGFRGTGKSTLGRILADELGWSFVDMDRELVASFGRDISTWVGSYGWEAFRDAESQLLERLAIRRELVLATGGGVVLRPANRELLKKNFFTIWLQASSLTIQSRLRQDPTTSSQRPALTDLPEREEIEQMLAQRSSLYRGNADLALSTDTVGPSELASAIMQKLPWHESRRHQTSTTSPGSGRRT